MASVSGEAFGGGIDFVTHFRSDRGAQVVAAVPQPAIRTAGGLLTQADNQIVVYFDDQLLNRPDAEDPKFFRLVNTGFFRLVNTGKTLASDDDLRCATVA